jgi:hypothetical protein
MWVRRSVDELRKDQDKNKRRRKSPIIPLVIGLIGAVIEWYYDPTLTYFLLTFFLVFVLAYIGQLFFRDALVIVGPLFGTGLLEERVNPIFS